MAKFIDLNADMGESYGRWSSARTRRSCRTSPRPNVACGFHGGDPHVNAQVGRAGDQSTASRSARHPFAAGPDGLGRRVMDVTPRS